LTVFSIFYHPDFTVGAGITPAHAFACGLYHRYGISPIPKDKIYIEFKEKISSAAAQSTAALHLLIL
jgi:hypothetical protein